MAPVRRGMQLSAAAFAPRPQATTLAIPYGSTVGRDHVVATIRPFAAPLTNTFDQTGTRSN